MLTGFSLLLCSVLEYRFLNEKFAKDRERSPAKRVLYIGIIYGFSFFIRTALNFTAFVHPETILNIQENGCNGSVGWAFLVFSVHFFGEILPLSLLFYL